MKWSYKTGGIKDELFIRGKVPMTKEEVRAVTLSKLRLKETSTVVDVGAGTGSISIEAAHICREGKVIAIERNAEGIELIKKNCEKFQVSIKVVHGYAVEELKNIPSFDRMMIGGSGGQLKEILELGYKKLTDQGICVINCITIENLYEGIKYLKEIGYIDIDVVSLNISRGKFIGPYTMMEGMNPIYIISAKKN